MAKTKIISPPKSFLGYTFKGWLIKNKKHLKLIASGIVALVVGLVPQSGAWAVLLGSISGGAAKWALDGIDFYFNKIEAK